MQVNKSEMKGSGNLQWLVIQGTLILFENKDLWLRTVSNKILIGTV